MKIRGNFILHGSKAEVFVNIVKDVIGATCLASYGAYQDSWIRFALIAIGFLIMKANIEIE